jgi:hypothetical protein
VIEEIGRTNDFHAGKAGLPLIQRTYSSIMDFCQDAKKGVEPYKKATGDSGMYDLFDGNDYSFNNSFSGVRSWQQIEDLCRDGWEKNLPETLNVVAEAVRLVEMEIEQFEPRHNLFGGDVDISAAVAGLPEDMVDYPLTRVSNVGTSITVCCDVQCHAGVSGKSVEQRGMVIVALALALDACGHQTELWLSDEYTHGESRVIFRTQVKGPNDFIDPAKIMYAYAHPSVQRGLGFCAVAGLPKPWSEIARHGYGRVSAITKDMPDGTLYIEPQYRYNDSPNLATELRAYLVQLGLLQEDEID